MSDELVWEYGAGKITLSRSNPLFVLTYAGEDTDKRYPSLQEAKDAIDARALRERKANTIKIAVPVLTTTSKMLDRKNGIRRHSITGIHGGHGGYTAKPPVSAYSSGIYLDHPVVLSLLEQLRKAQNLEQTISKRLYEFEIPNGYRGSSKLKSAEEIQTWYDIKKAEADARLEKEKV